MRPGLVKKIVIGLVAVLAASTVGLVGVSLLEDKKPAETEDSGVSTTEPASTEKQGDDTNDPIGTDTKGEDTQHGDTTGGDDTTGGEDTEPADTDPIEHQKAPAGFVLTKTFRTNTGKRLNTRIDLVCTANSDGTVHIDAKYYIEYWTLYLSSRKCTVRIGETSKQFNTPKISESEGKLHEMLLDEFSVDVNYGQEIEVFAELPYNGTYGDLEIKSLTIEQTFTVR